MVTKDVVSPLNRRREITEEVSREIFSVDKAKSMLSVCYYGTTNGTPDQIRSTLEEAVIMLQNAACNIGNIASEIDNEFNPEKWEYNQEHLEYLERFKD